MIHTFKALAICATLSMAVISANADTSSADSPKAGSMGTETGLEAWSRIYEVASHPRCSNCHTGPSDVPMWSGPSYGETRPHGMRIRAGESRIGAEFLTCSTCHSASDIPQVIPHAVPRWCELGTRAG